MTVLWDPPPPIWNILIVEDDPTARDVALAGVKRFIDSRRESLGALRTARTLREAEAQLEQLDEVHLVILDLGLPDGWGHDLLLTILSHSPHTPVIIHTVFDDDSNLLRALALGASGYVLKGHGEGEFAQFLTDITQGRPPLSPAIARRLLREFRNAEPPPKAPLTPKELEVVQYLARGLTNAETADCLGISAHTVSTHVKSVYRKLQVGSRAEMTGIAQKNGWVER